MGQSEHIHMYTGTEYSTYLKNPPRLSARVISVAILLWQSRRDDCIDTEASIIFSYNTTFCVRKKTNLSK